jgi:Fe-S cluster assembly protein SufD
MEKLQRIIDIQNKAVSLFENEFDNFTQYDSQRVAEQRKEAIEIFKTQGFPTQALESWRNTKLANNLNYNFQFQTKSPNSDVDIDKVFQCEIPHYDTHLNMNYNGWHLAKDTNLTKLDNGVVMGSVAVARKEMPELFEKHYGKYANIEQDGLVAMNTALAQDGVFIYIPDNVEVDKTIQIVNLINHPDHVFLQLRNLVVLGRNAKATLLQCDDSLNHEAGFINSVTEVFLDDGAKLDHYKLQNINDHSALINTIYFHQSKDSSLSTNSITLNGGLIRNDSYVALTGRGGSADVYGVYLMDKEQHVDNQVHVDHQVPDCYSNELFKGIIDDNASAAFNGYVHVHRDAQRTQAFQNNKNIALTDKAVINTKPFLEIYADDVKCSHGATIGQLDDDALFYIKSRGISEYNSKLLLMYAFAAEVVNTIKIEPLKVRVDDLVKKRLRGELSVCDQCVLHCSTKENTISFEIDMSKI